MICRLDQAYHQCHTSASNGYCLPANITVQATHVLLNHGIICVLAWFHTCVIVFKALSEYEDVSLFSLMQIFQLLEGERDLVVVEVCTLVQQRQRQLFQKLSIRLFEVMRFLLSMLAGGVFSLVREPLLACLRGSSFQRQHIVQVMWFLLSMLAGGVFFLVRESLCWLAQEPNVSQHVHLCFVDTSKLCRHIDLAWIPIRDAGCQVVDLV